MQALHAAGRDAEAVDRYALIRRRLADELGTDPGVELRGLHQAILRGELPAAPPPDQVAAGPAFLTSPAQLPADLPGFTGRQDELRHLDGLLAAAGDPPATAVVLAVSGTAGVGKTALATHWAHRVRDRFPDGQLHVNLRGFDPAGSPVTPAEAVRGFLDAFGVPPQRIPTSFEAQVGTSMTPSPPSISPAPTARPPRPRYATSSAWTSRSTLSKRSSASSSDAA
jgi:hypothetical protein